MASGNLVEETWLKIGLLDREYVFSHLYKAFPYLQLCLDHWKAKEISSCALSTWKNMQKKRVAQTQVKLELKPEADLLPIDPGSHKWKLAELEEPENAPVKQIHLSATITIARCPNLPLSYCSYLSTKAANCSFHLYFTVPHLVHVDSK